MRCLGFESARQFVDFQEVPRFPRDTRGGRKAQTVNEKRPLYEAFLRTPRVGLEPTTYRLTADRSTIELTGIYPLVRRQPFGSLRLLIHPGSLHRSSCVSSGRSSTPTGPRRAELYRPKSQRQGRLHFPATPPRPRPSSAPSPPGLQPLPALRRAAASPKPSPPPTRPCSWSRNQARHGFGLNSERLGGAGRPGRSSLHPIPSFALRAFHPKAAQAARRLLRAHPSHPQTPTSEPTRRPSPIPRLARSVPTPCPTRHPGLKKSPPATAPRPQTPRPPPATSWASRHGPSPAAPRGSPACAR